MNQKNWKYWAFIFNIFGSSQFIILTIIAMFFYAGGTYVNAFTSGYSFWYNYFSDLGRFLAHSGVLNLTSFTIFTFTMNLWGISQIPFYIALMDSFRNSKRTKKLGIIGSFFGILTGISFVGIAFTPSDILGFLHNLFVLLGFSSVYLSISLYAIVLFQHETYPKFYGIILVITEIILIIYYLIVFFIPKNDMSMELFIYVTGQKLIIYTLLICGIIQGYGALRHLLS
ncbi:MAG: hypothetical protein ACFE9M_12350 [Promethearchaeota archaeon]